MICPNFRSAGRVLRNWLVCVSFVGIAAGQDKSAAPAQEPLAILAGQPIYENQLGAGEQAQLQRMAAQVYAVRRRALESILDKKLLEAEAKKKGVSVEALVKSEADTKAADPSDADVSAFYQGHQGQINQPFDDAKDKIRQNLKAEAIQRARVAYVQGLRQQAMNDGQLSYLLKPPSIQEVPIDPSRLRGDPKASVTIVEFSDFGCSYCQKAEATVTALLAKYPGKVKLGYRDFPLRQMHPQAQLAAEASRCAGEQGKYWEYHDLLFAHPDKQNRDDLMEDARTVKLDDKQFDTCLSSGRYKPQIEQDILLGTRSGVVATPGFFVNGTFLNGAQPAAVFEKIIDEKLAAANSKGPAN
jgi:protein-disulfide isomerase